MDASSGNEHYASSGGGVASGTIRVDLVVRWPCYWQVVRCGTLPITAAPVVADHFAPIAPWTGHIQDIHRGPVPPGLEPLMALHERMEEEGPHNQPFQ